MNVDSIYTREITKSPRILRVILWPDPLLHKECENIKLFDKGEEGCLNQLFLDMSITMLSGKGIGLAAPQVGYLANFIILMTNNYPKCFINPKITEKSNTLFSLNEGCLSVPGYFEDRKRPESIIMTYQTTTGEKREDKLFGIEAFVAQHEVEHLCGKLFIDDLSRLKKERIRRIIKKNKKNLRGRYV